MRALLAAIALLGALCGPAVSVAAASLPSLWYGGDSISNAFMCTGCTVAERLFAREAGLRVLSSSVGLNGRTFAQFNAEVQHIPRASAAVVELGTNDFMQSLPLEEMQADAAALLQRVHASQLICLGVSAPVGRLNARGLTGAAYDRVIAETCAHHGGLFLPLAPALEGDRAAVLPDGVHITQHGYEVISQLLLHSWSSAR